jgi:hypothetical protein
MKTGDDSIQKMRVKRGRSWIFRQMQKEKKNKGMEEK